MRGYHHFEQSNRHSIERLNGFQITDLSIEFEAFDDALELEVGDVLEASHTLGFLHPRAGGGYVFRDRARQVRSRPLAAGSRHVPVP